MKKENIDCIKYNMLTIAHSFTNSYIGDLIVDFDTLDRKCDSYDKLIFIARRTGCELGEEDNERIKYYLNSNSAMLVYEIDLKAIANAELLYCYDLVELGYMKKRDM